MSQKKVLSKFTILCWAALIATLSCTRPAGPGLGGTPLDPCFGSDRSDLGSGDGRRVVMDWGASISQDQTSNKPKWF